MKIARTLAAALVLTGASWIDPHATAREASRLYENGDFEAATQKYNEALTDEPDSYLLQYNRGASLYRQDKFEDAAAAFGRAPAANPAEIAYNTGNAKYRLGVAAAESDPQKALGLYAEALAAYRRAMGGDPDDVDAKFNHELVEKKVEELKKKLEEQEQEQQQEQQEQEQQQQDQQQSDQQQEQEQQQDQQQDQPQDQPGEQQQQQQADAEGEPAEQRQQPESATSGESREGEMSEREARALLDAARDQEVSPEEIIERMQGAAVLEPSQDW